MRILTVPEGFIDRRDSGPDEYYPPGVSDQTNVEVIVTYRGKMFLYSGVAQSFGWRKEPAQPMHPGLEPCAAPITHYRIV